MLTEKLKIINDKLSNPQKIILGFATVILVGALLLMLPISTKAGTVTSFWDALFTSTSAICVTGLIVHDTATYWSSFGQAIILILIQIGGLGVVFLAAAFHIAAGSKISLKERVAIQDSISAPQVGGIVKLTSFIIKAFFIIELIGALLMMPVFCSKFGAAGVWKSFFHSISAFCNAGFDLMGDISGEYSSLTFFHNDPFIVTVISLLIVIGGIGFLTWDDLINKKFEFHKYTLQTKVVLVTTALLIIIPSLVFYFVDFTNQPVQTRILESIFQAITPRTAGFNTVDFSLLSGGSRLMMILLMLIGGSPGSTAGGMKTTTFAVMVINTFAVLRRKKSAHTFERRLDDSVIKDSFAIFAVYLFLVVICAFVISLLENISFGTCLFETASAMGTAGLTLGITPTLGIASKIILILLMFMGRIGGLAFILAATSYNHAEEVSQYPIEKITVG